MENLIKTLFTAHCSICGNYGIGLCRECLAKCQITEQETCIMCDKPSLSGRTHTACKDPNSPAYLFCAFTYKDVVRTVIRVSKYNQKEFYALRKLAETGATLASKSGCMFWDSVVVPIPLAKERSKDRGFNQSDIIARAVAKEFGLQVELGVLKRVKITQAQAKLNRQQREENLKDAFQVADQTAIKTRKVLLVDDICTTGSTFISAAKVLLQAGAAQVDCFALCKKVI